MAFDATKVKLTDENGIEINPGTEETLDAIKNLLTGFNIPAFDYIDLSYTGTNLTGVVYKAGGSSGIVVATLTLGYDINDNLISVTKT